MKAIHVKKLAMKLFRDLLYEETEDLLRKEEVIELLLQIEYQNRCETDTQEGGDAWIRYVSKVRQRFIDTKQFTREPEDPESASPESYELEDSDGSIHYEIKIEDNVEWTVESLKRKIEEMGGRFTDKDIRRMWDLRIRIELILTEDFLVCGNCRKRK
ncbi:hypothetical protein RirG_057300 [Rhizophagus irregularis DAOM 197198w]|uniref:Uncharacterized protein n=1 Tax=Rhizophagus irregularis (strain DAOM 197198w) TaxID=1432141 RepID=A0A015K2B0_RHIIW|nr:hypothetical protein RirG_057300 [Rhizophagus irregularis DAOM 197198w]